MLPAFQDLPLEQKLEILKMLMHPERFYFKSGVVYTDQLQHVCFLYVIGEKYVRERNDDPAEDV